MSWKMSFLFHFCMKLEYIIKFQSILFPCTRKVQQQRLLLFILQFGISASSPLTFNHQPLVCVADFQRQKWVDGPFSSQLRKGHQIWKRPPSSCLSVSKIRGHWSDGSIRSKVKLRTTQVLDDPEWIALMPP